MSRLSIQLRLKERVINLFILRHYDCRCFLMLRNFIFTLWRIEINVVFMRSTHFFVYFVNNFIDDWCAVLFLVKILILCISSSTSINNLIFFLTLILNILALTVILYLILIFFNFFFLLGVALCFSSFLFLFYFIISFFYSVQLFTDFV